MKRYLRTVNYCVMKTKVQYKLEEDIYNKHTVADIFHPKTKKQKQKQYQTYLHVGYEL